MTQPKRLIVACDGTWMNSDNGFERSSWLPWNTTSGSLQVPTNVTRMCRALVPRSPTKGVEQIVYYQAGVGSQSTLSDHVLGGVANTTVTGSGLSEHIREAYGFLAVNYEPGDEIFLIGFSRGAFTARSVAGLISAAGLLTRTGMVDFYPIFKDWENQLDDSYVSQWPDSPYPKHPKFLDPQYVPELEKCGLTRRNIPIKAIGVWDTVGSLGIPDLGIVPPNPPEYAFINTDVSPNVEHAFHALALDEHRKPFSPTIWEKPEGQPLPKTLTQCWFPGVHANIGGSYPDTEIADITLAWMMAQLDGLLDFDPGYIAWQRALNVKYYESQKPPQVRPWAMGQLYNSLTGYNVLGGSQVRTPGHYRVTDPKTGKPLPTFLADTQEFVHPCVRIRIEKGGKGDGDQGVYKPGALKGWKLLAPGDEGGKAAGTEDKYADRYRWVLSGADGRVVVLPEMELGGVEVRLRDAV
ncbi:hypothetical protein MMC30_006860 [Trapelia coarctata]|nr:hypothetical protein [Trapelia coarctata]